MMKQWKMIHVRRIVIVKAIFPFLSLLLGCLCAAFLPWDALRIGLMLLGMVLCVVLLLKEAQSSIFLSMTADMLSAMAKDRKSFPVDSAPKTREEWVHMIAERTKRYRVKLEDVNGKNAPVLLYTGKGLTLGSDRLERLVAVFSVEKLDEENYNDLLQRAQKQFRSLLPKVEKEKKASKVSYGTAAVVILLADTVDESLFAVAKETKDFRYGTLLPVVVDVSRARAGLNGERNSLIDPESDARRMAARLVFGKGGSHPKEGEHTDAYLELYEKLANQTYGEHLAEMKQLGDEGERDEEALISALKDGEAVLDEGILYYRDGEKVVSMLFMADDEEEHPITGKCETPRTVTYDTLFLDYIRPKKKTMTEKEKAGYLEKMLLKMAALGYTTINEDDTDA